MPPRHTVDTASAAANKALLVKSPQLAQLLIEGLLLDPSHVRYEQADEVKAAIQCDAAECLMQLALHAPTREALQRDLAVIDALRTLAGKAMTEKAKRSAEGALMALDPQEVHHREVDPSSRHVMMSYQWDVQNVVTRVVSELQHRGYNIWFDVGSAASFAP